MDDGQGSSAAWAPRRWIGGASVPTLGGSRVNATEPLAALAIRGNMLELRLRGPLAKLARAETLQARPADLEEVFPIRSRVRFRGVGFRRPDGREYYFKTWKIDEILDALAGRGFPVSLVNQPAAKIWSTIP